MNFRMQAEKVVGAVAAASHAPDNHIPLWTFAAQKLQQLLPHMDVVLSTYRLARPGEALMYAIASEPITGVVLYLVSDGVGVVTPPHEHLTWSAVVGLGGIEQNHEYQRVDRQSRAVRQSGSCMIGRGDVLALPDRAIHSTGVVGNAPTCLLHLYGKPLDSLPALRCRAFTVTNAG